jgi:putative flippase GtrA
MPISGAVHDGRRFLRFLLCGGFAAAANWSSRFFWSLLLPFGAAVIAAYATGMIVAFALFRRFVFEGTRRPMQQVRSFINVNLVGIAVTWTLANLLVFHILPSLGLTNHVEAVGHAIAITAPIASSWFGHRYLTFR